MKIALVDDEPAVLLTLSKHLQNLVGIEADCFQSGEELLKDYKSGTYDVIMLDM